MSTSEMRAVAAWVAQLRAALGLTQAELGGVLKVSKQTVWLWEAARSYPRDRHLLALQRLVPQVGRAGRKGRR